VALGVPVTVFLQGNQKDLGRAKGVLFLAQTTIGPQVDGQDGGNFERDVDIWAGGSFDWKKSSEIVFACCKFFVEVPCLAHGGER